ncbi:MAG: DUF255 domain-containing protein [Ignavibacteria bacterium]|nr:DUF255 domain-containing protein [Ignavibacteria bacterium]
MINWIRNFDFAKETARKSGKAILLQFRMDNCSGCKKMNESSYLDKDIIQFVNENYIPLKLDIVKDREGRRNYPAIWTPSFYFADYSGKLFYSIDGYLNQEDFLVVLNIGLARVLLSKGKYNEVYDLLQNAIKKHPKNPRTAALYMLKAQTHFLLNRNREEFLKLLEEIAVLFPNSAEARQID